jgi:hypothetical protein
MPDPSTPCGRATLETALRLLQGWPTRSLQGARPASIFYPFGHPTPYPYGPPLDSSVEKDLKAQFCGAKKCWPVIYFTVNKVFGFIPQKEDKDEKVRNFPCQTLKINKISLVVMGS